MKAGLETPPAPPETDTTKITVRAEFSPHTSPAPSFESSPLALKDAQRICFDDVHAYLAEQDEKARLAIIEEAHSGLKASIDTPYEDISPDDYDRIRLTSSLLLSNYWDLDTETARLPDNRETAFAAYLSIAKVYLSRAANSESWQDAAHLEETALPYLIAGLATQARPDQDAIDGLEKSLQNDDDSAQDEQADHTNDSTSSTQLFDKMHKEAFELIDLIVYRRENKDDRETMVGVTQQSKDEAREQERIGRKQVLRAKIGSMTAVLAEKHAETNRLPSLEAFLEIAYPNGPNGENFEGLEDFQALLYAYEAYREKIQSPKHIGGSTEQPPLPFAGSREQHTEV